jgi:hypothetical protein
MLDRLRSLIVALSLAILIWLYARSRQIGGPNQALPSEPSVPVLRRVDGAGPRHSEMAVTELEVPIRFLFPTDWKWRAKLARGARSRTLKVIVRGPTTLPTPAPVAYVDLTQGPLLMGYQQMPIHLLVAPGWVLECSDLGTIDIELLPSCPRRDETEWPCEDP